MWRFCSSLKDILELTYQFIKVSSVISWQMYLVQKQMNRLIRAGLSNVEVIINLTSKLLPKVSLGGSKVE